MEKPKPIADFLCARLRALRKKHDLTQEAFTEIAQMNLKHYQEIEAGGKRELRLSTIERIAKAYKIEIYQLFALSNPPSKFELSKIKPLIISERIVQIYKSNFFGQKTKIPQKNNKFSYVYSF